MAKAREAFIGTMRNIRSSLSDDALSTKALVQINLRHNETSRLLRRGLFVVAFNTLEDFLKSRTAELLERASDTQLRFSELPPGLRSAAINSAYNSGVTQARFQRDTSDSVLQDVAAAVASTTGGAALHIHRYAFLHASSNVGAQDIADVLAALHVKDPWGQMNAIAAAADISTLPLRERYSSLHEKRNAAAHDTSAMIEVADLRELVHTALVVALSFDMAASSRILRIYNNIPYKVGDEKWDVLPEIKFRTVREHDRGWAEMKSNGAALKVHGDFTVAVAACLAKVKPSESVVISSSNNMPVDWYPYGY